MPETRPPFTERAFVVPLVLVTSLFFLWALGVNLNDILIPHLKKAFGLSDFQSSLIQTAFFGGYFLAALPAGWVMRKVGYKRGIIIGLVTCATGAFLFIPASYVRLYPFFLFALFVMACGQSFLEVGANPYVTTLGPEETAPWRLNTAQAFNSVGAVVTPVIGATFILSGIEYPPNVIATMPPDALEAWRVSEASAVRGPYLVITAIFLLMALLFAVSRLPEVRERTEGGGPGPVSARARSAILKHRHLVRGVIAQFLYVGAQVGVASFVIRFVQRALPGTPEKTAAEYLFFHLVGFMIGRFLAAGALKYVKAPAMLAAFAAGAFAACGVAVTSSGAVAVWMIVLIGFFHSLMFPTIFALSLEQLGPLRKLGASLLVMAIVGGAIIPAVMGRLSDMTTIQTAFLVPLVCYVYVFWFAVRGHRPDASVEPPPAAAQRAVA